MTAERFPEPDADGLAVSRRLVARIQTAIDAAGGWLGFDRFMQLALNEPGLGYYAAGSTKIGAAGDFTTAPEIGDWFAEALAGFIGARFDELGSARLLELGAGSGRLAAQLLTALARRGHRQVDYRILETSADLRRQQQSRLDGLAADMTWLDTLRPQPVRGIVLANEVADALPVTRFVKQSKRTLPLGIVRAGDSLAIVPGDPDPALDAAIAEIEVELGRPLADGYRSEICLLLRPWLTTVLGTIEAGGLLLIDYGLPRRDYYRAERADGTFICHYRQRAHSDALLWPGLQDLSAWVDFSAVAAAAAAEGFTTAGYTTQAQFLVESIATDPALAARQPDVRSASALKTLVLPGEMGERFKLIWLTRGFDSGALPGRDFRDWL